MLNGPSAATPRSVQAPPASEKAPTVPAADAKRLADQRKQVWSAMKLPTASELAAAKLTVADGGQQLSGVNEKYIATDEGGRKYLFKPFNPNKPLLLHSEVLASKLRTLADEPCVPAGEKELKLPTGAVVKGYAKPLLPGGEPLPGKVSQWSEREKAVILADLPWAEFMGNYDTKPQQYVRIGGAIVNVDWDRSIRQAMDNGVLTRFKAIPMPPPSHGLLLYDFVHGAQDLDFKPLFDALDRIDALPDHAVREAALAYGKAAEACGQLPKGCTSAVQFADAFTKSKHKVRERIVGLVNDAKAEREHRAKWLDMSFRNWGDDLFVQTGRVLVENPLVMKGYDAVLKAVMG